jgi:glycosyltransferase involved in cell wall biosynthesis
VAALTASAEIAVVPSLYEGFSLPAVEHMASGTPLVVSRTGALPEVVGDAAVLAAPGDPEELAAALRDLLDSPERRAALSQAAWGRVQERFTWSAVARAVVAEYHRAIAATGPRGQGPGDGVTGAFRPSGGPGGRPPDGSGRPPHASTPR